MNKTAGVLLCESSSWVGDGQHPTGKTLNWFEGSEHHPKGTWAGKKFSVSSCLPLEIGGSRGAYSSTLHLSTQPPVFQNSIELASYTPGAMLATQAARPHP